MLEDRNLSTQVYSEEMAIEIAARIPGYLPKFRSLADALSRRLAP